MCGCACVYAPLSTHTDTQTHTHTHTHTHTESARARTHTHARRERTRARRIESASARVRAVGATSRALHARVRAHTHPPRATMAEVTLDPAIRSWVLLPITFVMLLIGLLRHLVMQLTKAEPKVDADAAREAQTVARAARLRANGVFLPAAGYAARKAYFAHKVRVRVRVRVRVHARAGTPALARAPRRTLGGASELADTARGPSRPSRALARPRARSLTYTRRARTRAHTHMHTHTHI